MENLTHKLGEFYPYLWSMSCALIFMLGIENGVGANQRWVRVGRRFVVVAAGLLLAYMAINIFVL